MLIILVVNHDFVIVMLEVTPTALPLATQRFSINHNPFPLQMVRRRVDEVTTSPTPSSCCGGDSNASWG